MADPEDPDGSRSSDVTDHGDRASSNAPETRVPSSSDALDDRPFDAADERMAEILAGGSDSRAGLRRALRDEGTDGSDDLLARLNALDFVDSLAGGIGADIPERLGDYRITGMLGRGGMGTVYEAFQESLERTVALKVLSPGFAADVRMRERFRSEARATASLHHQHIVPIYGYGEAAGYLYFTMEKVEGVSLDKWISGRTARRNRAAEDQPPVDGDGDRPAEGGVGAAGADLSSAGPLSPTEAAARFVGVADALAHAHRRRLLHRDVKPGNILVHADGTLALADFGLSKMLDEVSRNLTGGAFLGTLHYSAPEQAKGAPLTEASDLYSLGVTMFETVTGELPLKGNTTEAMLQAVLHGRPRRLCDVVPGAPRDLEAVLDKLLQKEPEDRYADGEELARDLRRVAEGDPIKIRRQPLLVRAWRRAKKNPVQTAAIFAATFLTAMVLYLTLINVEQRQQNDRSRYENRLNEALQAVSRSSGDPFGPAAAFTMMTGVAKPTVTPDAAVTEPLDRARALLPEDQRASELLAAFVEDPLPDASERIEKGDAVGAINLLDAAINQAKHGYLSGQDAVFVRIYRLYLMRGAVRLSALIGQPELAARDFFAASWIRSGAKWPQLVLAVLDADAQTTQSVLRSRLLEILGAEASPAERQAVGHFLRAFAGVRRPGGSELMVWPMPFSARRRLDGLATEFLTESPAPELVGGPWAGSARRFANAARSALAQLSNKSVVDRQLAASIDRLARTVHPGAPLQSWAVVFRALQQLEMTPRVRPGVVLTPDQEMRGWLDLLRLQPPTSLIRFNAAALTDAENRARAVGPGSVAAAILAEVQARRALLVGNLEGADAAIEVWFAEDPEHPQVKLFRFRVALERAEASFDASPEVALDVGALAATAWQSAADRTAAAEEVVRALNAAAARGGPLAERWRQLATDFGG